jgi:hypothetical protein
LTLPGVETILKELKLKFIFKMAGAFR